MVLLLDDDDDVRKALAALLRDDGYEVIDFPSPADVPPLDTICGATALVVDHQMPGEDGLAFADRFHAAHPDVPVVMVSANLPHHLTQALGRRPHITFRPKPVDYECLAACLPRPPKGS